MTDPVLIVGAGPTGLTAALELSRLGVAVRLIEKAAEPATTSRAIGVQARTLELLDQRGLAEEMVRLGNPAHGVSVCGGGKRVFRLDFTRVDSRHNYLLFLSQAETERILREAIGRQGVTIERGVELVGIGQDALSQGIGQDAVSRDASPVTAILRHADGKLEQTKAPWLIDAEGAHSLSRTTLDLQFEGKTLDEQYALGDLHVDGDLPDSDVHIFSSEHGFMGLFPMGRRHYRLIASNPLSKPEKGTEPSLDELQRIYDQRSHIPAHLHDMVWSSWFHINSRMVSRLKIGRLLLGGDAAHIHSPAGGQGMNTGIQDMINLGWKLAFAMQGKARDALLDTYEQDRLPVMRDVLFTTEKLTDMIGAENHFVRSIFNHLGPYIAGTGLVQENATARMSQVALGYRDSSLSENHVHGGSLRAGDRVPDLRVRHRTATGWADAGLQALLAPSRCVLLVAHWTESEPVDPALREAAAAFGEQVAVAELCPPNSASSTSADHPRRYEAVPGRSSVYLVRPDGYVGLSVDEYSAATRLAAYRQRWFASESQAGFFH